MHGSLAAAVLLAACAAPAAAPAPAAEARLELQVKVEKDAVALGDPIRLQCKLTSRSARALNVAKLRIGSPNGLVFYLKGKERTRQVSRLWGRFQGAKFTESAVERVPLKKGESLTETIEILALLQGEFEVRAVYLGGDRTAAPDPVEAKGVKVTVGPGPGGETRVGARIRTDKGDMTVELLPEKAFNTVMNWLLLARQGFYKDRVFHRVIKDFMVQTGCPQGNGQGGPGWYVPGEPHDLKHEPGTLSMALEGPKDTGGSQFFIMTGRAPHLDPTFTIFGRLAEGKETKDTLEAIRTVETRVVQGGSGAEASDPVTKPKLLDVVPILLP